MRRGLTTKLAMATATAALAFGAVACEVEDDGTMQDDGTFDDGLGDDGMGDDGLGDDGLGDG